MNFKIEDMTCKNCEKHIREALMATDSEAVVTVDLKQKQVSIQSVKSEAELRDSIRAAGYTPQVVNLA